NTRSIWRRSPATPSARPRPASPRRRWTPPTPPIEHGRAGRSNQRLAFRPSSCTSIGTSTAGPLHAATPLLRAERGVLRQSHRPDDRVHALLLPRPASQGMVRAEVLVAHLNVAAGEDR